MQQTICTLRLLWFFSWGPNLLHKLLSYYKLNKVSLSLPYIRTIKTAVPKYWQGSIHITVLNQSAERLTACNHHTCSISGSAKTLSSSNLMHLNSVYFAHAAKIAAWLRMSRWIRAGQRGWCKKETRGGCKHEKGRKAKVSNKIPGERGHSLAWGCVDSHASSSHTQLYLCHINGMHLKMVQGFKTDLLTNLPQCTENIYILKKIHITCYGQPEVEKKIWGKKSH